MDPALIFLDVTPKTPADQEKLAHALQLLTAEDAGLRVRQGVDSGCTVIGATSEAHLEQVVDRLAREFRVEASVGRPAIAYKETVTRSSEGGAKYVTHARPNGEFAYVALRLHPCAPASGYRFDDTTIGGSIPHRLECETVWERMRRTGRLSADAGGFVFFSLCYVVLRRVLQLAALRVRSNDLKELEIVVLRHDSPSCGDEPAVRRRRRPTDSSSRRPAGSSRAHAGNPSS